MTEEHKLKLKEGRERKRLEQATNKSNGNKELTDKIDSVVTSINVMAGAINKLVELQTDKKVATQEKIVDAVKAFDPAIEDETYPNKYIPPKYRAIASQILSPEFGIDVLDFADRTDFQFSVIVPEKFSSVSQDDRAKGVRDIRSRMIPRALGENGVREWCTLIRNNLARYYQKEGIATPFTNATN